MKSKKVDIKYLGIPNVCFSLTKKDDDRELEYSKQRMQQGFDESETWSLANTIAKFILPRLKFFRNHAPGHNGCYENEEQKNENLDKMIIAFELIDRDNGAWIFTDEEDKKYDEGIKLFAEYFKTLWW